MTMKHYIINSVTIFLLILVAGCTNPPKIIELELEQKKDKEADYLSCESFGEHVIAADKRGNYIPVIFKAKDKTNKTCNVEIKIEQEQEKSPSDNPETDANKHSEKPDSLEVKAKKHFNKIVKAIKKSEKKPLVFIHGGLNDYEDSLGRLIREVPQILNEVDGDQYYPVFVIWPSGADTYFDSLVNYLQGEWDRPVDKIAIPFKVATDMMAIFAESPENYMNSYRLASNSTFYLKQGNVFFNDIWRPLHSAFDLSLDPNHYSIADDPCMNGKSQLGIYCVDLEKKDIDEFYDKQLWKRLIFFPAKVVLIPMAYPLATRAWDSMNARIRFTFRTPCRSDESGIGNCKPGVVYQFFDALDHEYKNNNGKKITLIGHSMGAIVAGEIIRKFHELPYENVIFGGAAISIREFKNTVEATLLKKVAMSKEYSELIGDRVSFREELLLSESTEKIKERIDKNEKAITELEFKKEHYKPFTFYNLSLHPFAEAREENMYGLVPSGSLLEWIDQMIENPADGLDRTLGKWANIAPLLGKQDYQKNGEIFDRYLVECGYMHFSRYGLDSNQPLKHMHLGNADGTDGKFKYWKSENWKLGKNQKIGKQLGKTEC